MSKKSVEDVVDDSTASKEEVNKAKTVAKELEKKKATEKNTEEAAVEAIEKEDKSRIQSDDEVYDPKPAKKPLTPTEVKHKKRKKIIIISIIVVLLLAGIATACYFIFFYKPAPENVQEEEIVVVEKPKYYSKLSGLEIENESINSMPTYCIQIPNGLDGARPQTGLDSAAVIFEAIAEAGITRFAAIFQNPQNSVIGPIRSLRSYYLDWDTPFDCTIVHAGGSNDAIAAVRSGGYRDLTESYDYMWRDQSSYWAPNNLMTSPALLAEFNKANGYNTSNPVTFSRLLPNEATEKKNAAFKSAGIDPETNEQIKKTTEGDNTEGENTETITPLVESIDVNFGYVDAFNVHYQYNRQTNSYLRSYQNGQAHLVYSCPDGLTQPSPKTACGDAKQLSPSAIVVIKVDEYLDSDGYHQVVQTIGTGTAYIFQNGTSTKGVWVKNNKSDQITFKSDSGEAISFTPGQIFISAIPNGTGSVKY